MSELNCSCGSTCSEVERLEADLKLSQDEVAYLRKRLNIDAYGNPLTVEL